jgi:hypothetical protein
MRRRKDSETEETKLNVREWWREEEGSDARMAIRTKLKLWLDRVRDPELAE